MNDPDRAERGLKLMAEAVCSLPFLTALLWGRGAISVDAAVGVVTDKIARHPLTSRAAHIDKIIERAEALCRENLPRLGFLHCAADGGFPAEWRLDDPPPELAEAIRAALAELTSCAELLARRVLAHQAAAALALRECGDA